MSSDCNYFCNIEKIFCICGKWVYLCYMKNEQKIIVQVYENLSIELTINESRDGYTFKTPKAFGGRYYYSFSNHVADAFAEQYPDLEHQLRINQIKTGA